MFGSYHKPVEPSIFVSLDMVHACYPDLGDVSWSGKVKKVKASRNAANKQVIVEHKFEGRVQSHAHRLARRIQTKTAM